ncbi:hypothetical protein AGLY_017724 [Aphis glycines]|uniref:Transposable element P transposase-like RNase H C-terminal domain-containing protein n=1 Tax=Aphis glycines TaxID=307491 RepID=A0A6G0SW80_APHGL|nr:hypothetical protein AGLY_017724 [Aphis glycines]
MPGALFTRFIYEPGSSLSAGLVVSELLPTTPIRFEEPKKDYTKVRNTECVELVFPSPSKYTTTDISDIIDMPSPITPKSKQNYNMNNDTPRKKKLKQKIFTQQHQMQNKKKQISKLKNRINNLKNRNHLNNLISSHKFRSNHLRAILRNKRRQWTIEEKNLALTMFYKSPATYNFLRLQNLNLPGPSTAILPCFSGLTQTINGVLSFFDDESKNNNIQFLFTNRLNQDTLENLFSIFRQKGGYNKNPTSRTIRTSFRSTCVFSLITSKGTNCESSQNIDNPALVQDVITPDKTINEGSESCSDTASSSSSSSPTKIISEKYNTKKINESITLEDCSVTYFSGYLAYKCIKKFNCIECKINLIIEKSLSDKNQILLIHKNYYDIEKYTGLMAPSNQLNHIIDRTLSIFETTFQKLQYKKKLRSTLLTVLKKDELISNWIDEKNNKCADNYVFILEKLLICKIFRTSKTFSTTSHQIKLAKLKILSHI